MCYLSDRNTNFEMAYNQATIFDHNPAACQIVYTFCWLKLFLLWRPGDSGSSKLSSAASALWAPSVKLSFQKLCWMMRLIGGICLGFFCNKIHTKIKVFTFPDQLYFLPWVFLKSIPWQRKGQVFSGSKHF